MHRIVHQGVIIFYLFVYWWVWITFAPFDFLWVREEKAAAYPDLSNEDNGQHANCANAPMEKEIDTILDAPMEIKSILGLVD